MGVRKWLRRIVSGREIAALEGERDASLDELAQARREIEILEADARLVRKMLDDFRPMRELRRIVAESRVGGSGELDRYINELDELFGNVTRVYDADAEEFARSQWVGLEARDDKYRNAKIYEFTVGAHSVSTTVNLQDVLSVVGARSYVLAKLDENLRQHILPNLRTDILRRIHAHLEGLGK